MCRLHCTCVIQISIVCVVFSIWSYHIHSRNTDLSWYLQALPILRFSPPYWIHLSAERISLPPRTCKMLRIGKLSTLERVRFISVHSFSSLRNAQRPFWNTTSWHKYFFWVLDVSVQRRRLTVNPRIVRFIPPCYIIMKALISSSLVFYFPGDDGALSSRTLGTLEHPPRALVEEVSNRLIKSCASQCAHHISVGGATQYAVKMAGKFHSCLCSTSLLSHRPRLGGFNNWRGSCEACHKPSIWGGTCSYLTFYIRNQHFSTNQKYTNIPFATKHVYAILTVVLLAGPFNMRAGFFPLSRSRVGNPSIIPAEVLANIMTIVCSLLLVAFLVN